jgi:hypothetical protein
MRQILLLYTLPESIEEEYVDTHDALVIADIFGEMEGVEISCLSAYVRSEITQLKRLAAEAAKMKKVKPRSKKILRKERKILELINLHLDDNEIDDDVDTTDGWYYGNRKQFIKRLDSAREWVTDRLLALETEEERAGIERPTDDMGRFYRLRGGRFS